VRNALRYRPHVPDHRHAARREQDAHLENLRRAELHREERDRAIVGMFTEDGMKASAIAAEVGVSNSLVRIITRGHKPGRKPVASAST